MIVFLSKVCTLKRVDWSIDCLIVFLNRLGYVTIAVGFTPHIVHKSCQCMHTSRRTLFKPTSFCHKQNLVFAFYLVWDNTDINWGDKNVHKAFLVYPHTCVMSGMRNGMLHNSLLSIHSHPVGNLAGIFQMYLFILLQYQCFVWWINVFR